MTIIKIIKNEEDYRAALELVEKLMEKNPEPESEDGEKLNLLAKLVEDYEKKMIPGSLPDPIDAIEYVMEQQNLKPVDLAPYIGSRGKVSEVLSRKRSLSIDMIRALAKGLGIPVKVLLQETDEFRNAEGTNWTHFPVKEMIKRGYIEGAKKSAAELEEQIKKFFRPVVSPAELVGSLRKTYYRSIRPMDKHALAVWSAMVIKKAKKIKYPKSHRSGTVNPAFMQEVARLSIKPEGPIAAQNFLRQHGIALIIEPVFPQTYLDGATIMTDKKHPIIGLTLRYDRLDNFWFSLMHELAHISLHHGDNSNFYYDNLDNPDPGNRQEEEADRLAGEALLPESKWEISAARIMPNSMAAENLATELGVHPAIIAGQMRHRGKKYTYLNKIINEAQVRPYFSEIKWNK